MLTKGQRDDFLAYMSTGTLALWALGGVPGILSITIVGACGLGVVANQTPSNKLVRTIDEQVEDQLRSKYGEAAVETYRTKRASGMSAQIAARDVIFEELQRQRDQIVIRNQ